MMMKGKCFTFLLITLLGASTPAFAQTLVIFKDSRSIEVDSVRYENNQCIYTKNGSEKTVPLDLIEEIYVLNKGKIYPPQHHEPQQQEPVETQEPEGINETQKPPERNKKKKKSEDNTARKDTVEPAEQTYLYKSPQGYFQCEIPKSWNHSERIGVHLFSPYSLDGKAFDKFAVHIVRSMDKADITTISKEHKARILEVLKRQGEKLLLERERVIDGIEAWEKFLETTNYGYKTEIMHEIMLVHNGYFVSVTLKASPELFESADREFEKIIESLDFL